MATTSLVRRDYARRQISLITSSRSKYHYSSLCLPALQRLPQRLSRAAIAGVPCRPTVHSRHNSSTVCTVRHIRYCSSSGSSASAGAGVGAGAGAGVGAVVVVGVGVRVVDSPSRRRLGVAALISTVRPVEKSPRTCEAYVAWLCARCSFVAWTSCTKSAILTSLRALIALR